MPGRVVSTEANGHGENVVRYVDPVTICGAGRVTDRSAEHTLALALHGVIHGAIHGVIILYLQHGVELPYVGVHFNVKHVATSYVSRLPCPQSPPDPRPRRATGTAVPRAAASAAAGGRSVGSITNFKRKNVDQTSDMTHAIKKSGTARAAR